MTRVEGDPGTSADLTAQILAQFEPDPDRTWTPDYLPQANASEGSDDPQWIVWLDSARESAWVTAELTAWTAALRAHNR